ncbi:hypothetical protein BDV93DRAFT_231182 [Ceratobasidium sp. AG-I]|nr:hypothetical protein BDV93DRAFT_231182 [Ceratobasidium sp. AG-I]
MLNKIKRKAKEKGRRYANKILGPPPPGSAAGQSNIVSINETGTDTPVPNAALPEPALDPNVPAPPVALTSAPRPVIASSALPTTDTSPPTSQKNDSSSHAVQDRALVPIALSASGATPGAGRSAKSMAWSGLKTLLDLLSASADAFEPLRSAVGGISECINIYEVCT